ncbi:MAG: electron transfer flavoprotein subunit beta/FixA family protein [Nitrososphaerota archaeon]
MRESNIIVLVKHVVDTNALKIDPTNKQPVLRGALTKISDYDKHAIEEAVRLKEKISKRVVILSVGPEEAARTTLREALAMGADEAILVSTGTSYFLGDPLLTIRALVNTIRKFIGNFELIIAGDFSEDLYQGSVGIGVAILLNIPFISSASSIEIVDDKKVIVKRELEQYIEVLEATLPLLISVSREINQPRIPTTLQIMKVPLSKITIVRPEDIGIPKLENSTGEYVTLVEVMAGEMPKRKGIKIEGHHDKIALELLQYLEREGVI